MKIGIQNFRTFKELTEFEIRPLTILIGPNNSGKSSITKFMLLQKNGWEWLSFSKQNESYLESFKKSLNWESNSDELKFKFSLFTEPLINQHYGEITYEDEDENKKVNAEWSLDGKIKKCSLFNELILIEKNEYITQVLDSTYFIFDDSEDTNTQSDEPIKYSTHSDGFLFKVDIQGWLELLKMEAEVLIYSLENNEKLINIKSIDAIKKSKLNTSGYSMDVLAFAFLYHESNNFSDNYLLYDVLIDDINVTADYKDSLIRIQNDVFEKGTNFSTKVDRYTMSSILKEAPNKLNDLVKEKIHDELLKIYVKKGGSIENAKINIKENKLGRLLFKEKIFPVPKVYEKTDYQKSFYGNKVIDPGPDYDEPVNQVFFSTFVFNVFKTIESLSRIAYIPANRGSQQRVFHKGSYGYNLSNEHNRILKRISKEALESSQKFIKDVQNILQIEGDIKVESFENAVSAIYIIKSENEKQNLADYGFGYSQLIPIILKLSNISAKFLIIEEPEANLHPGLQSKLADIFLSAIKNYKNLHLVIETHSEYIVRKLQNLVALNELNPNECIIHYFNSDDNVSINEPKVKPIEINNRGILTDNFGPGFYDETTKLQFDLMKIRKEQNN